MTEPLVFEDRAAFLRVARQAAGLDFDKPEDDDLLMTLVEVRLILAGTMVMERDAKGLSSLERASEAIAKAIRLRRKETASLTRQ